MARAKRVGTFRGECPRCEGTGLWNGRAGYQCRGCNGSGQIDVAIVQSMTYKMFRVVSAKGNVTKENYYAPATLVADLDRYNCGATIGSGWWEQKSHTNAAGTVCHVYGFNDDGDFMVRLPGGGYSATGRDTDDERRVPQVVWAQTL